MPIVNSLKLYQIVNHFHDIKKIIILVIGCGMF